MLTATMYNYLKANKVQGGVWDTIVKESPIIQRLPFLPVDNDVINYNVELTMPVVQWADIDDTINESRGTIAQRTTNVYTVIGDVDTSKKKKAATPGQDPEALDIAAKAKAMAHAFELAFIAGQTSTVGSTKEFKGLFRILAEMESGSTTDWDAPNNDQIIAAAADSGALTMALMDELLDQVRPGKADMLLCSRRARRKLNGLLRAVGTSGLQLIDLKEFGIQTPGYDNIALFISDFMPDNLPDGSSSITTIASWNQATTRASTVDNTAIVAMKLGENEVTGLQLSNMEHERETFLENKDSIRNRFKWYVSAQCKTKYSIAALVNVNPDS
jgi:hypothetical protein